MLVGLARRRNALQVDLARGQDRAGGDRRLAGAGNGVLDDSGRSVDEGATEGLGDRPALAEGAFHEAGVPGAAPGRCSKPSGGSVAFNGGPPGRGVPFDFAGPGGRFA